MKMKTARVIFFTNNMEKMVEFYRDVMDLPVVTDEKGWKEFDAGGITIALHSGPPSPGKKGPKLVFYAKDVAKTRDALVARGAKFGKAGSGEFAPLRWPRPGRQPGAAF